MCRSQSELNKKIHKISMQFSNELPNLNQNTGSSSYKQEKIMLDFADMAEKKRKVNMKLTVIPVIIRVLGIVLKILTKKPEESQNQWRRLRLSRPKCEL